MCNFVETMRVDGGKIALIKYHNRRFNRTLIHCMGFGGMNLGHFLRLTPDMNGVKARLVYGEDGVEDISYEPYTMRSVKSLKLVTDDTISYDYKSTDRAAFDRLMAERGDCDDILIVKNGLVTDTSFTNVAFYDGKRWLTPASPLLCGTRRAFLLDKGTMEKADIPVSDISRFSRICLFNAMIDFGVIEFDTTQIR